MANSTDEGLLELITDYKNLLTEISVLSKVYTKYILQLQEQIAEWDSDFDLFRAIPTVPASFDELYQAWQSCKLFCMEQKKLESKQNMLYKILMNNKSTRMVNTSGMMQKKLVKMVLTCTTQKRFQNKLIYQMLCLKWEFEKQRLSADEIETVVKCCSLNSEAIFCCICRGKSKPNEVIIKLFCNHSYHIDCIKIWFKIHPTCPTCRMNVRETLILPTYC